MKEDKQNNQAVEQNNSNETSGGKNRSFAGVALIIVSCIAFCYGVFQFFTGGLRILPGIWQYNVHIGLAFVLTFLFCPAVKKHRGKIHVFDVLLIFIGVATCIYAATLSDDIVNYTVKASKLSIVMGTLFILVLLEATRRRFGMIFPSLIIIALLYALLGHLIPGTFGHSKFAYTTVIKNVFLSQQGVWGGLMPQISAGMLSVFLIFGAIIMQTGGAEAFMDVAFFASANTRGGAAKVACISSALFGMISGSSVSNAATTGSFTIGMMKRSGFRSEFAAAVEGIASAGGALMPPIMGAGAFLMAQFTGIKYSKICIAALIPAVLYYLAAFTAIHLESLKYNMQLPSKEEIAEAKASFSLKNSVLPLLPILILIGFFIAGYTVQRGAFWSCIASLIIAFFRIEGGFGIERFKKFGKIVFKSFSASGTAIANIAVLLATAQIMVSMLGLTGITVKFSDLIVTIGASNMLATLVLSMIVLIILGMGVPITAVYVLGASLVAPALVKLGVDTLAAHLFTFYFACLSTVTPPVCSTIFVTSSLAGSNWWKSGFTAVRLAMAGFVVPYAFVYKQTLLLNGNVLSIAIDIALALIGALALATFAVGYFRRRMNVFERALALLGGLLMIYPETITDLIGAACVLLVIVLQFVARDKAAESV